MRIYVCGGRQRNTGPLISWCYRSGSKLQQGFKSFHWQWRGPEGTRLFQNEAEVLGLGKVYKDAQHIGCFLVEHLGVKT